MSENEVIPALGGVLETSLYVDDVEHASEFYRALFGFEVMISDSRFCAMSVAGKQVLLLFKKGSSTRVTVVPGGDIRRTTAPVSCTWHSPFRRPLCLPGKRAWPGWTSPSRAGSHGLAAATAFTSAIRTAIWWS